MFYQKNRKTAGNMIYDSVRSTPRQNVSYIENITGNYEKRKLNMKIKLLAIILVCSAHSILFSQNVQTNTYPAKYLSYYSDLALKLYNSESTKLNNKNNIQHEAQIFKGRSVVIYLNQIKNVDDKDIDVMNAWGKIFKAEDFIKLFKRKVLVKEFDKEYWIIMQEKPITELQNDAYLLLYYYYIGCYNDRPIFISPGFED
jgi:hypothetical protein